MFVLHLAIFTNNNTYFHNMNTPYSPQNKPYSFPVESGKEYLVCMCGKSFKQPLCDGNHTGSGIGPRTFIATESGNVSFCGCKYSLDKTGKCDGTHSSL